MHTITPKKNRNIVTGNVGHVSRTGHNTQKKQRFGHRNDKRLNTRMARNRQAMRDY